MLVSCSRQRYSEELPSSPPTVYLVYYHQDSDLYTYSFYALEIAGVENNQVKPLPEPLFRFNKKTSPVAPGFVALDSKIYVVGGQTAPGFEKNRYVLDTYVFDTATAKSPPTRFKSDDPTDFLIKGPRLNAPKFGPILVTFEGKIYAFPRLFSSHSPPSPKCEMLDVNVGSWIPLPDPPLLDQAERNQIATNYTVEAYVIHDGCFFASTRYGIYSLDLSNPSRWRQIQLVEGVNSLPFVGEAISVNGEYFATFISEGIGERKFLLCKYGKGLAEEERLLNLLSGFENLICFRHDKVMHFKDNLLCVVRCGLDRHPECEGSQNFLCLDIFQVNEHQKKKRKKEKKNQSGLAHLASSKFIMDNNLGSYGCPLGCFAKQDG